MDTPSARQLCEATGISPSYAHMILSGERSAPRALAIAAFRSLGWKHHTIAELSDAELAVFEKHEPWTPPKERAAA